MHQPPLWQVVVLDGSVLHRTVVPHQQVSAAPLVAINESGLDDMFCESGYPCLRFFRIHPLDPDAIVAHNI